ncbi:MAG: methyltransferase [Cellulomonadaceae bacterium]|nr:methyltransferase [Cellulomonadaceae bacterium]
MTRTTPDQHYFTAQPASADLRKAITVTLRGRELPVTTAPGVFSPDRLDPGTSVLLRNVPSPPTSGNLLDVGCGWGPITLAMALESPNATVWAVDVNERALDLVRRNAESLGLSNIRAVLPDDIPAGLSFDALWSNPPIRIGKPALHALLSEWLPRVKPSAEPQSPQENTGAWLVVQKNLGADSLARWIAETYPHHSVTREASQQGYRILRVQRPA